MDTAYLKKVAITLVFVIISAFFIFYIGYHLYNGFTTDISTVIVEKNVYKSSVTADGFIFRDETCLTSRYSGTVNYLASDGEKVGAGAAVAQAFADSSGYSAGIEISDLDKTITLLENCLAETGTDGNIAAINQKISSSYSLILSRLAEGKIDFALSSTDDFLSGLTKRDIITGDATELEKTIQSLKARKSSLSGSISGKYETVVSEKSGYFFESTDGFEELFTPDKIMNSTVDELFDLLDPAALTAENTNNAVGKIVSSYRWYVAVPLQSKSEHDFIVGKTYDIVVPSNFNMTLKMKLEKIVLERASERSVLIFSCGEMPEGFNYKRSQVVTIQTGETEGFRIPTTALRVLDGIKGVYTLDGSTVKFKRIHIVQSDVDGYYVAACEDIENAPGADEYGYLKLHDSIIVSGKDLKHGMVFY